MAQIFRKKPVAIEAVRWMTDNFDEVVEFCPEIVSDNNGSDLIIKTLEGNMRCSPFDWIIKGVNGEFYPCKSDIFEKTYEEGDVQPVQTAGLSPKALEIVGKYGLDCPDCNNEGFYWQGQDDPEMIQCQFCYVEAKSKYNLKQDLIEMIGGLSC